MCQTAYLLDVVHCVAGGSAIRSEHTQIKWFDGVEKKRKATQAV
jgi:hypothetical protein